MRNVVLCLSFMLSLTLVGCASTPQPMHESSCVVMQFSGDEAVTRSCGSRNQAENCVWQQERVRVPFAGDFDTRRCVG